MKAGKTRECWEHLGARLGLHGGTLGRLEEENQHLIYIRAKEKMLQVLQDLHWFNCEHLSRPPARFCSISHHYISKELGNIYLSVTICTT